MLGAQVHNSSTSEHDLAMVWPQAVAANANTVEIPVAWDLFEPAPGSFDTVMALDVIEHLDDEVGFLRAASELCSPDGVLIIAVPAFQWMWSQHDETFQHRRRYSARQLRSTLEGAGLEVERLTYTNLFPFPLVALWRLVSHRLGAGRLAPKHDFFRLPGPLNRLLIGLYALEAWLLGRFDLPFGVSVVGIARRTTPGAPR